MVKTRNYGQCVEYLFVDCEGNVLGEVHIHDASASEASRSVIPRTRNALMFRARYHQIDDILDAEMIARFGQQDSPNACLLRQRPRRQLATP